MSYPYYEQVQRAYDELVAEGKNPTLPDGHQEMVEQQKGLLCQRAGYYSNLIDSNIGVLAKTSGNNYLGYSVDTLIHKDGTIWDVVTDDGHRALPVNGGPGGPDPNPSERWRQPTKELAQVENGNGEPEPPPSDDEVINKLNLIIAQNQQILETQAVHTQMLQTILDKPAESGKFPIIYPDYRGRVSFVGDTTLRPIPRENP